MKMPVKLTACLFDYCQPFNYGKGTIIKDTLMVANYSCLAKCYMLATDTQLALQDQAIITVLLDKHITLQQLINSNAYQKFLAKGTAGMPDSYSLDTSQRWHCNQQLDMVINHYHDNGKWQQHNPLLTTRQPNRYGLNGSLTQAFVKRIDDNYHLPDIQLVSVFPLMTIIQQMHARNYAQCIARADCLQRQQQLCYVDIPMLANSNGLRYLIAATKPMIQIAPIITNDAEQHAAYSCQAKPITTQLAIGAINPYVTDDSSRYEKTNVMQRLLGEIANNSMLRQQLQQL